MSFRTRYLRPTLQSLSSRGPAGTLRSLVEPLLRPLHLSSPVPPLDPYPPAAPPSLHPFDLTHRVDTSGYLRADQLHTTPGSAPPLRGSALWSTSYYAIAPSLFDQAFHLLTTALSAQPTSPPISAFTFIDLGCGKGRALFLAARQPFQQVLGVELDPTLASIAQHNLLTFHDPAQRCHNLRVLHADATSATLFEQLAPTSPTLLFLYHPFLAPILRRVLRNLTRSLAQHPRPLWIVYFNPEPLDVFRRFPAFHQHCCTLLHIAPEDDLPDRFGFRTEDLAIFEHRP